MSDRPWRETPLGNHWADRMVGDPVEIRRELADELQNVAWLIRDAKRRMLEALADPERYDLGVLVQDMARGFNAYETTRWARFRERMGWQKS